MKDRPILFTMGTDQIFPGFTDGTHWNGFANVRVTAQTHVAFVAYIRGQNDGETSGLDEIPADADGLHDYGLGFCAELVDVDEVHGDILLAVIEQQQAVQKTLPPASRDWGHASALLAMLFAEMARRTH